MLYLAVRMLTEKGWIGASLDGQLIDAEGIIRVCTQEVEQIQVDTGLSGCKWQMLSAQ